MITYMYTYVSKYIFDFENKTLFKIGSHFLHTNSKWLHKCNNTCFLAVTYLNYNVIKKGYMSKIKIEIIFINVFSMYNKIV